MARTAIGKDTGEPSEKVRRRYRSRFNHAAQDFAGSGKTAAASAAQEAKARNAASIEARGAAQKLSTIPDGPISSGGPIGHKLIQQINPATGECGEF